MGVGAHPSDATLFIETLGYLHPRRFWGGSCRCQVTVRLRQQFPTPPSRDMQKYIQVKRENELNRSAKMNRFTLKQVLDTL